MCVLGDRLTRFTCNLEFTENTGTFQRLRSLFKCQILKISSGRSFLNFFETFVLVDTAHLLILGSFFELKVRFIHEKIRYILYDSTP